MSSQSQKRDLLVGAATALVAGVAGAAMFANRGSSSHSARDLMQWRHLPNVPLQTHSGRTVRFYDDLVKNRKVVFNVMYTICSNICTPATQNIRAASELLGSFAHDINFYSLSLTPLDDDPAALRAYKKLHDLPAHWTFLTGKPEHVEAVRRGLGFQERDPAADLDLSNHSGMLRIGNEATVSWGHASALNPARSIARMIRFELT